MNLFQNHIPSEDQVTYTQLWDIIPPPSDFLSLTKRWRWWGILPKEVVSSFPLYLYTTWLITSFSLSLSLSPQFSYIVWKNCILAYLLGNHLTIISLHSFWLSRVPEALMTLSWASDTFPTLLNTNFSPFLFWYLTFLFDKNLLT